ncbi:MAG: FtsQ-type POTRA domain-containing protein, partial [Lachnospiraceae bacterium]|nr:FtsQ-type POTRA domain-containing protein [Lachnospiraceae bacterium]
MYKSRGKLGIKILLVLLVLAIILGLISYLLQKYTISTVYVEGNVHYTEEEVKQMVMDGPLGNNSLYLSVKYKNKGVENIPFVDVMDVSILSPDTIKITVYEKALVGFVRYLDTYMYFDKDGYVVESSGVKTVGIPQVTGLTFDHVILGEPLPVENTQIFNSVLNITKLLNKYELVADKIYFHSSDEVTIYFGDVKVSLGNDIARLEDKVMLLPGFLEELAGKSGILQMEIYDEGNGKYTF